ncbi:hypothetical protein L3V82_01585 [Thiotrichales bacterium 19S3-7]|nr:hypothetical protein [Thiotrichales bacterium 19S3-7]MCF6800855.1 hypothetical protein [Thiotrichales bacterium 19S3-11]
MLEDNQLLAIGAAFVRATRKTIKYSENIEKLYEEHKESLYYYSRKAPVDRAYMLQPSPERLAQLSINSGAAYCDGLAAVILYMANMLNLKDKLADENVYLSLVTINNHTFCILHQSEKLAHSHGVSANSFDELSKNPELKNAVIVDPWIYKATQLSDYKSHIKHADTYGVGHLYNSRIEDCKNCIKINDNLSPKNEKEQELLNDFDSAYLDEIELLKQSSSEFAVGRKIESIKKELTIDVKTFDDELRRKSELRKQLQEPLEDLYKFIEKLKSNSSLWYSGYGHTNRKGQAYQDLLDYIELIKASKKELSQTVLKNILICALRLAPIIRGSDSDKKVSISQLDMTSTAKSLLTNDVIPNTKYKFEAIEGMDLDDLRKIINNSKLNEREKYTQLMVYVLSADPNTKTDFNSKKTRIYNNAKRPNLPFSIADSKQGLSEQTQAIRLK